MNAHGSGSGSGSGSAAAPCAAGVYVPATDWTHTGNAEHFGASEFSTLLLYVVKHLGKNSVFNMWRLLKIMF